MVDFLDSIEESPDQGIRKPYFGTWPSRIAKFDGPNFRIFFRQGGRHRSSPFKVVVSGAVRGVFLRHLFAVLTITFQNRDNKTNIALHLEMMENV